MRRPGTIIFDEDGIWLCASSALREYMNRDKPKRKASQDKECNERTWYSVYNCVEDGEVFEVEQATLADAELVRSRYPGAFITVCRYNYSNPGLAV